MKMKAREQKFFSQLAALPPVTVQAPPLFLAILVAAMPDIVADEGVASEELGPYIQREAREFIDRVLRALPTDARRFARSLLPATDHYPPTTN